MPDPFDVSVPGSWRLLMSRALDSVALEVEFTAWQEDVVRRRFALEWDSLETVPGTALFGAVRWTFGTLADGAVLYVVIGELVAPRRVELVGFRVLTVEDDRDDR